MTTPKSLKAPISSLKKKGIEMVATKENIRAAYIAPIKSVVCIDDDFPTFAEILREEKKCSTTKEEVAGELTDPDSNPFLPKFETAPSIASSTSPRLNPPRNKDKERVLNLAIKRDISLIFKMIIPMMKVISSVRPTYLFSIMSFLELPIKHSRPCNVLRKIQTTI